MLDTKSTRTTITLPEDLLFEIKKRALLEKKTIKEIINESLSSYLGFKTKSTPSINSLFGAWGKGISGNSYLKKVRYGKTEKEREEYLGKLWKKS
ncbi:hypothetical protein HYT02_05555 [Candidatus Gottesmanbacteria bacterium]|nr:hypothetical protein [Candidatus Gottesmanbacteria bacterium]